MRLKNLKYIALGSVILVAFIIFAAKIQNSLQDVKDLLSTSNKFFKYVMESRVNWIIEPKIQTKYFPAYKSESSTTTSKTYIATAATFAEISQKSTTEIKKHFAEVSKVPNKPNFVGISLNASDSNPFPILTIADWQVVNGTEDIRLHTAFLDDRPGLLLKSALRITGIASRELRRGKMRLLCLLWYGGNFATNDTIEAKVDFISSFGTRRYEIYYDHFAFVCPLASNSPIPSHVSIISQKGEIPTTLLAIELPEKPKRVESFGTCLQTRYGRFDPYRIIEWIEIQRILGIRMIGAYHNGVDSTTDKIFRYYQQSGFVDYRPIGTPLVGDKDKSSILMAEKASLNNCLLRNMYRFEHIMIIDTDEIIIPQKPEHRTYKQLFEYLNAKYVTLKTPAPSYTFRNAYFWMNFSAEDQNQPQKLVTLRVLNRLPPSPEMAIPKTIINTKSCLLSRSHYCLLYAAEFAGKVNRVEPQPDEALSHHYKKCFEYKKQKARCEDGRKTLQRDAVMLKYKEELIERVNRVAEVFGLPTVT